jgi:hypothetical protein
MMETYFDQYNKYLNFLLKVECSKQDLDYDETLKSLMANREVTKPEEISKPEAPNIFGSPEEGVKEEIPEEPYIPEEEPELPPQEPPVCHNYDLEFDDGYYIGETQNGLMHGFGTRYWNDGSGKKWEGGWQNGEANGYITVSFDDVITYEGNMANGLPNGKGTYTDSDTGRVYIGEWVDFRREGEGKVLTVNGEKIYEGEWLNDKWHGYGQSFLKGICRYEGAWEYGKRHGEGIAYDEDGNVEYNGRWENNDRMNE